MINEQTVESALDFLRDNAVKISKARAERIYLEQFRKSKKAMYLSSPRKTPSLEKNNGH